MLVLNLTPSIWGSFPGMMEVFQVTSFRVFVLYSGGGDVVFPCDGGIAVCVLCGMLGLLDSSM